MGYLYAEHVIEDYDRWETHHEENADDRLEEALEYFRSDAFQSVLDAAGVVDVSESGLLDLVHEADV